jgi:hypothetical protein
LKGFRLLEMGLRANWQQISEIPPRPPFVKGGLGGFTENSSLRQHSLFGSGWVGLGMIKKLTGEIWQAYDVFLRGRKGWGNEPDQN